MCVIGCYTAQTGGKGSRKSVNQTPRLAKCTRNYSKNVIYNRYNIKWSNTPNPPTPELHTRSQIKMPTFSDTWTHTCRTAKCGFTHQWELKSALPSNVNVMHTVGPNSCYLQTTLKLLASQPQRQHGFQTN